MAERMVLHVKGFDPNPVIAITSNMPGLVACQEIFPEPKENLICLLESEFRGREKQNLVLELGWQRNEPA